MSTSMNHQRGLQERVMGSVPLSTSMMHQRCRQKLWKTEPTTLARFRLTAAAIAVSLRASCQPARYLVAAKSIRPIAVRARGALRGVMKNPAYEYHGLKASTWDLS